MSQTISNTRGAALRALAYILCGAALAWVLFIGGRYWAQAGEYAYDTVGVSERIRPSDYLTIAAIAALGLGALIAKRQLAKIRAVDRARSELVDAVTALTHIVLVVAAVFATWAVFLTFMSSFFDSSVPGAAPLVRLLNVYVPIVLYTALVLLLILAGFVFVPAPVASVSHKPATLVGAESVGGKRDLALAYIAPIVAAAVALILGLIVYDLTRTAVQAWVWVAILAIIAAGVIAGTVFAERSRKQSAAAATIGARNLNFVLSIIFTIVASIMSLTYAMSAVSDLRALSSISISAFDEKSDIRPDDVTITKQPIANAWGSDLERGSQVQIVVEPGATVVAEGTVGRDRWLNLEASDWASALSAGDYQLRAIGVAASGETIESTLPFTVQSNGNVAWPKGTDKASEPKDSILLPLTVERFVDDFLPPLLMLALAMAVLAVTITVRNREQHALETGAVEE